MAGAENIQYNVEGKLLNGIKSMYVNNLACIKCFRIKSGVRQGCISYPQLFNANMEMGRLGERLPDLLYANDLVLCGKLEEDLKRVVGCFDEVCRSVKANEEKSKAYPPP